VYGEGRVLCPSRDMNEVQGFVVALRAVSHNVRAKTSIVSIAMMYKGVQGIVHWVHNGLVKRTFI